MAERLSAKQTAMLLAFHTYETAAERVGPLAWAAVNKGKRDGRVEHGRRTTIHSLVRRELLAYDREGGGYVLTEKGIAMAEAWGGH